MKKIERNGFFLRLKGDCAVYGFPSAERKLCCEAEMRETKKARGGTGEIFLATALRALQRNLL